MGAGKNLQKYLTQWAAQFYAAAELSRRGYTVALTLGNTPRYDLMVRSPKGQNFRVEVKGQKAKNFWIIGDVKSDDDLYYIFVYVPGPNKGDVRFFIFNSAELPEIIKKEADAARRRRKESGKPDYEKFRDGFYFKTAEQGEGKWDILPK